MLHAVVREHLETWLARTREAHPDEDPIPRYVEDDFRRYLTCGLLSEGFGRARCRACGHDFLVAFSCSKRGVCPSCTTRHMAETAAHLVDHVFPEVPVRQWVVSVPKRLRYFLHRDMELTGRTLHIVLRALEAKLKQRCPGAPAAARLGAVTFIQRFGSALNRHTHLHCCVIDGLFSQDEDGNLCFHPATELDEDDVAAVQGVVRQRVLRLFERRGVLGSEAVADMRAWPHSGFSIDASVTVCARDRAGLERLLRYCARPAFASQRLVWENEGKELLYRLPKPRPDGQTVLCLTPLEFIERLAALIPPPRRHRHRYHGVLAPVCP